MAQSYTDHIPFYLAGIIKKGHFGDVYTGILCDDHKTKIAAKKFLGSSSEQKEDFLKDIQYMDSKLRKHENIVTIMGYIQTSQGNLVFMEYEELRIRGKIINDLLEYLMHLREDYTAARQIVNVKGYRKGSVFPDMYHKELHLFSFQIVRGCEYLESRKLFHGNLAARNILLTQQKNIKLADFGFLNVKKKLINSMEVTSPLHRWAGPETLGNWHHSVESDVWSFGIVLWEIGTLGAHPYSAISDEDMVKEKPILKPARLLLGDYKNFSTERLKEVMRSCWSIVPEKRPSFKSLLAELAMMQCESACDQNCIFFRDDLSSDLGFCLSREDYLSENTRTALEYFNGNIISKLKFFRKGKFGNTGKTHLNDPIMGKITGVIKVINSGSKVVSTYKKTLFEDDMEDFQKIGVHKNVKQILGVCLEPIAIMTEYQSLFLDNGKLELTNLKEYLLYLRSRVKKSLDIDNQELGWFAIQIARGMQYLENLGIVHSSLKATNILIDNAKILKITDFGKQGRGVYKSKSGKNNVENYQWTAPEVFLGDLYSSKSDVWAFAVVLWEIATLAAHPFASSTNNDIVHLVVRSKNIFIQPNNISRGLWNLMNQCWYDHPDRRPGFTTIYSILNALNLEKDIYIKLDKKDFMLLPTEEECESQDVLSAPSTRDRSTVTNPDRNLPKLPHMDKINEIYEDSGRISSSYPPNTSQPYRAYNSLCRPRPKNVPPRQSNVYYQQYSSQHSSHSIQHADCSPPNPPRRTSSRNYDLVPYSAKSRSRPASISFPNDYQIPKDYLEHVKSQDYSAVFQHEYERNSTLEACYQTLKQKSPKTQKTSFRRDLIDKFTSFTLRKKDNKKN